MTQYTKKYFSQPLSFYLFLPCHFQFLQSVFVLRSIGPIICYMFGYSKAATLRKWRYKKTAESIGNDVTFESSRCKTSILTVQTACIVFKCCQKVQFGEPFIKYLGSLSENWKSLLIVYVFRMPLWKSFNYCFEIKNTKPVHTCGCRKTNLKHYYRLVHNEPIFRAEKRNKYKLDITQSKASCIRV